MTKLLSQHQIGRRIAGLRKMKSLSQEELAKRIQISRPALAQIELGKRSVDALELQSLAMVLGISLDELMSEEFPAYQQIEQQPEQETDTPELRKSEPVMQVQKLKNVLLYMLERCAGKPNVGETVLYKLLYFADFNYYELFETHLTGLTYRKLPYGPVPQHLDALLLQMIEAQQLYRLKTEYHGYPQTRYLPLIKADLTQMKATEKEVIDRVIEQMSDWSAAALSQYSHKDLPWLASKPGEAIHYELAFYREAPFSVRNYEDEIEAP